MNAEADRAEFHWTRDPQSALQEEKGSSMDQRKLVKNFYLFTGVTPNDLRALGAIAERKAGIAGDHIYSEGDVANALFIVEMGR